MAKILLAEDDPELNSIVRTFLLFEHHKVESVKNGADANEHLMMSEYDLLILDWDLPGMTGLEILSAARANGKTMPILLVTGKSRTDQKMTALDSGADDYLTKPFQLDELGARVRALLRRSQKYNLTLEKISVSDIMMDTKRHRATKGGVVVDLLPKEFELLEFFMRNPNHVFAPDLIMRKVWPSESEVTPEAIRTTVKRLRKKVDPEGKILRTVHGVGYVMEAGDE
jgi:DNA-binding response OmpR family regulator